MTVILKQDGFNDSEKYLAELCSKTFLSLWSYPNVYTDEGKKNDKGDGKELCDLLVVFNHHVIIFSDKDIGFKDTGNIEVEWGRWVKRAVLKSANQLYGAESWILERSNRIYLDPKCKNKFPLNFPASNAIKIHRIAVAKNATKRFASIVRGSGSLIINPLITGNEHLKNPFMIGIPIPGKPYIHVFDDVALDVVLHELDTISDFVDYLEKKEELINSGKLISAAGEEDLLAFYLMSAEKKRPPGFYIEAGTKAVILEGQYESLRKLPQYHIGKEHDKISYFWDGFIEHFAGHALGGTLLYENKRPLSDATLGLQVMASERRIARRALSKSILEKVESTPPNKKAVRIMFSPTNPNHGYIWLILPIPPQAQSYEEYRHYRKEFLYIYCTSAKLLYPNVKTIIGIATEPRGGGGGEDMIYLDTTSWEAADFEQAEIDRKVFGVLLPENVQQFSGIEYQYPVIESKDLDLANKSRAATKTKKKKKAQKKSRKLNHKRK
ncbi:MULTISPECIES: hypothetical protein [Phytobacter]|uniref:Preprotein translocase SecA chain n=1 Tax=Phytobacter diazotrophicus TaxID=395631 RepID=A0ABM7VNM6_9ENTR|nr:MULTISPECIES: hypothetical protein [Phytobacter]BBE75033.1 preprotein translocase SecA chain [Phytobacter sp. MRY16-398]BDD48606.1 preprotein translocase SecA chain [Phytobacter diazotrophicus]BEG79638.1 SEC-C domain-containing protein [Phytobacter diazotrophicus]BEG85438.1 SEC-C domain-containing protein [Phytobacter diazotrophicus]BEG91235.1 SEC-C domain-containing protein [Phytobacter diazotrophicus]